MADQTHIEMPGAAQALVGHSGASGFVLQINSKALAGQTGRITEGYVDNPVAQRSRVSRTISTKNNAPLKSRLISLKSPAYCINNSREYQWSHS